MIFSILATIRAYAAPKHHISCSYFLWKRGVKELRKRGKGLHESGAFLLGSYVSNRKVINEFLFYDDLDSKCLDTGIVVIDGVSYGKLWDYCRKTGLEVVGDVHTHPGRPWQSLTDRKNPMIGIPGHIAIIIPNFAKRNVSPSDLGIYEYLGEHKWREYLGLVGKEYFYVGL